MKGGQHSISPIRAAAEQRGRKGEEEAARWFEAQSWVILATRVRTKAGEVDLVVRRDGVVAFVEVKWRRTPEALAIAIDARRLARVAAAAHILAQRFVTTGDNMRVDVLLLAPGTPPHHIINAWMPFC